MTTPPFCLWTGTGGGRISYHAEGLEQRAFRWGQRDAWRGRPYGDTARRDAADGWGGWWEIDRLRLAYWYGWAEGREWNRERGAAP